MSHLEERNNIARIVGRVVCALWHTISMQHASPTTRTSITLPTQLLNEAKTLGINVSQQSQAALAAEIKRRKCEAWLEKNRAGIEELNVFTETHGVLTAKLRTF
ncbi:MAG: type II toxin-antitoxin system CcdA family antitoxin [Hyphomonadaceae bacterium]|nr:type II toxin-antitoxin system CcdA family antitoxin [Hyphomonadaceae bacterium]